MIAQGNIRDGDFSHWVGFLRIYLACSWHGFTGFKAITCGIEKGQAIARGRRISEGRAGPAVAAVPHASG